MTPRWLQKGGPRALTPRGQNYCDQPTMLHAWFPFLSAPTLPLCPLPYAFLPPTPFFYLISFSLFSPLAVILIILKLIYKEFYSFIEFKNTRDWDIFIQQRYYLIKYSFRPKSTDVFEFFLVNLIKIWLEIKNYCW